MLVPLFKKIHRRLLQYPRMARVLNVLGTTPRHALHWYALLLLGIIVVSVNLLLAWNTFTKVGTYQNAIVESGKDTMTINREDLKTVLDTYRAKKTELDRLKQIPPAIIDPGR